MDAKAGMISYLRFVYGNDKGATKRGQMFNNSLYKGVSDPYYSSDAIVNEPITISKDDTEAFLSYYPIIPGTLNIAGVDETNGTIALPIGASGANVTATIHYETGKLEFATAAAITDSFSDAANYAYDNETAPVKVPQVNLELAQIPVFAKSRKLAAYWGFDAAYDLKKQLTNIMVA